jgi:hypothetical protein
MRMAATAYDDGFYLRGGFLNDFWVFSICGYMGFPTVAIFYFTLFAHISCCRLLAEFIPILPNSRTGLHPAPWKFTLLCDGFRRDGLLWMS